MHKTSGGYRRSNTYPKKYFINGFIKNLNNYAKEILKIQIL